MAVAREAIKSLLMRGTASAPPASDDPAFERPAGAFVSLHIEGQLRGCIGTLYPEKPVLETVSEMACAAATSDPRFPAITLRELRDTDIEISILTPFEPIDPAAVEVGRHGLYVAKGPRRGVLLPQVPAQFGWDRETFLDQACHKAGLPANAWRLGDIHIMAFEAQVFSDLGELSTD